MKIQQTLRSFYLLGCLIILAGCTDFLDTDLPSSQLTGEAVFKDRATATAAVANIYAGLRDQTLITGKTRGIGNLLGLYSDELDYYGSNIGTLYNFSNHTVLATESEVAVIWNDSYNLVYACNSVLEGLDGNDAIPESDKTQLQGEALFLRGFIHFYLNQLFGDIPYIIQTDYNQNAITGKLASTEIYEHLVSDLEEAISLLPETYTSSDRVRVNQFAAMAFLARVQLYFGNWEASLSLCNTILDRTDFYIWEEDLDNVFLKGSKSTLWQLKPISQGGNTYEGQTFIFETGPPNNIGVLSQSFMDGFASDDQRADQWTRSITDGSSVWFHPYKYKLRSVTGSSMEHSVVLRLAELYLIRAEARLHLGDLEGAMTDLNKTRNRAGLSDVENLAMSDISDAILIERRYELFTEYGHRWFDLKRNQKAGEVLAPIQPNWQENHVLFPIPETELLANPNLNPQNDGY